MRSVWDSKIEYTFSSAGTLFSLDYPPPGLIDDPIPQLAVGRDLPAELVDYQTTGHVEPLDPAGLLDGCCGRSHSAGQLPPEKKKWAEFRLAKERISGKPMRRVLYASRPGQRP
jgi:hypothetical protein